MGSQETTAESTAAGHAVAAVAGSAALHDLSSEELAWRARQGCQAAFGELVSRYAPRLRAFLNRKIHDAHEAEDLAQDALLKAYERIDRYDGSHKFSTWLYTIAARLAVSRHRRRRPECGFVDPWAEAPACDAEIERREQRRDLWGLAAELPGAQYRALWLKYGEDMSVKEMARAMGKSQVCVKVLLYRGRVALAKRLKQNSDR